MSTTHEHSCSLKTQSPTPALRGGNGCTCGDPDEDRAAERELDNVRSRGGDYWTNDAGEWCCV